MTTIDENVFSGTLTLDETHSDPSLFNNNDVKLVDLQSDSGIQDRKQLSDATNTYNWGNTVPILSGIEPDKELLLMSR